MYAVEKIALVGPNIYLWWWQAEDMSLPNETIIVKFVSYTIEVGVAHVPYHVTDQAVFQSWMQIERRPNNWEVYHWVVEQ